MNALTSYYPRPCACCAGTWPLPSEQPCVACRGFGHVMVPEPAQSCTRCGGKGRVWQPHLLFGFVCEACLGSGWMAARWIMPSWRIERN